MARSEGKRHLSVKLRQVAARRPYLVGRVARRAPNDGQRSRCARKRKVRRVHVANPFAERNLPGKRVRVRRRGNRIVPRNRRNVQRRVAPPRSGRGRRIRVAACVRGYARRHAYRESACAAARNRGRIYVGGPGEPRRLGADKRKIVRRKALDRLAERERGHERPCRNLRNAAYLNGRNIVHLPGAFVKTACNNLRIVKKNAAVLAPDILRRRKSQLDRCVKARQVAAFYANPVCLKTLLDNRRRGRRAAYLEIRRVHILYLAVESYLPDKYVRARRRSLRRETRNVLDARRCRSGKRLVCRQIRCKGRAERGCFSRSVRDGKGRARGAQKQRKKECGDPAIRSTRAQRTNDGRNAVCKRIIHDEGIEHDPKNPDVFPENRRKCRIATANTAFVSGSPL